MSEEPTALKLASTEDLLAEIVCRAHSGVVGLTRPHKTDPKLNTYKLRWFGDAFKAQGLAAAIIHEINDDRRESEDSIPTDEF